MVKREVCGMEAGSISKKHLESHGLTTKTYKELYPNSKLVYVSEETKELMSAIYNTDYMKNMVSRNLKGRIRSEAHCNALKAAAAREDKVHRSKINGDNRRGHPNKKKKGSDLNE